ncbi:PXA domain-containing protein [Aspergillus desertorum]
MTLKHRDYALAGLGGFVTWGFAIHWLPVLRYLGYALILGAFLSSGAILSLVLLTTRDLPSSKFAHPKTPPVAFVARQHWKTEVQWYQKRAEYHAESLYPKSFIVSEGIDELLSFISRDFIASWHRNISPNPAFSNEVDKVIRTAIGNLRDRLLGEDIVSLVVSRIFPILTTHLKEFDIAERSVRGRNLTRNVTESEELDLAIAKKYRDGHLHPAATLSLSDQKAAEQEYLRKITVGLLPQLFPAYVLNSRIASVLIREILSCAVLFPLVSVASDPDTWNQLMEAYGRTTLQDRKTVRKLRAALDEHASPAPKSKRGHPFPRLSPNDSERAFERFVRTIRRCNNLSDARRFRALVASQLKRESMVEGQDPVYLRRLETGKRVLDQKVAKLSAPNNQTSHVAAAASHFRRKSSSATQEASLIDVMHDASGLSYFMEFMDRQHLMSLVQFWIVVDGFRNPLEDDFGDESSPSSKTWTTADRNDMALISATYLTKPELKVTEESRQAVKAFLSAGRRATPEQYRRARTVILSTQSAVLEELQEVYFPKFKQSDLYWKYLASDDVSHSGAVMPSPSSQQSPAGALDAQGKSPLPPLLNRTASQPGLKPKKDLRRAAISSNDVPGLGKFFDGEESMRRSMDSERSAPLFDDDYDTDPLAMSTQSLNQDTSNAVSESREKRVIESMEAALNDIITNVPKNGRIEEPSAIDMNQGSTRNSIEPSRVESRVDDRLKPSIASLGLVDGSSRRGVFDDDLFPEQQNYPEDEYEEPEGADKDSPDEVHEAAPGDLGLTEAIQALTADIEKLGSQEAVVDTLTRKAELTNNTAELRILRKSKMSIQRELHRKEMQRQQYMIQESDNSLYGRSTIRIKSIVVGKEEDGREFAMYVIDVQRNAGEQMPAASWAVARRYSEFHELHHQLRMRYPSVRQLEFPRRRMVMKLQKEFLQKRRLALEAYLQQLLLLPEVCRSRDLRAFLSQRAIIPRNETTRDGETKDLVTRIYNSVADGMDDFLGNFGVLDQLSIAGQNLISAATSQQQQPNASAIATDSGLSTEDAVTTAEAEAELTAFEDRELEPFIKPICDLFLETFELNKGNNWLRGRAVVVVLHQLLGGTIERKVREGARSLFQDEHILRYLTLIKDTLWPGGVFRESRVRTASERLKSRTEASLVLATLVPELAGNLVGRANAQAAARRIFATLNNQRLNAHLIFTLLDEIVLVLFGGEKVTGRTRL